MFMMSSVLPTRGQGRCDVSYWQHGLVPVRCSSTTCTYSTWQKWIRSIYFLCTISRTLTVGTLVLIRVGCRVVHTFFYFVSLESRLSIKAAIEQGSGTWTILDYFGVRRIPNKKIYSQVEPNWDYTELLFVMLCSKCEGNEWLPKKLGIMFWKRWKSIDSQQCACVHDSS